MHTQRTATAVPPTESIQRPVDVQALRPPPPRAGNEERRRTARSALNFEVWLCDEPRDELCDEFCDELCDELCASTPSRRTDEPRNAAAARTTAVRCRGINLSSCGLLCVAPEPVWPGNALALELVFWSSATPDADPERLRLQGRVVGLTAIEDGAVAMNVAFESPMAAAANTTLQRLLEAAVRPEPAASRSA